MRRKIKIILVVVFILFLASLAKECFAQSIDAILVKSKHAIKNLKRVKMKSKTTLGSIVVTSNIGAIDYGKNEFFINEERNSQIISSIYVKDATTYMYNGIVNSWIKVNGKLSLFENILDKEKMFYYFPDNPEEAGFKLTLLGEMVIDGQECYYVESEVSDIEKAKITMRVSLGSILHPELLSQLQNNKKMADAYLESSLKGFLSKRWISKDNFYIVKTRRLQYRLDTAGQRVPVTTEISYYDFNKAFSIDMPQEAGTAREVTKEELGLGG